MSTFDFYLTYTTAARGSVRLSKSPLNFPHNFVYKVGQVPIVHLEIVYLSINR